MKAVTMNTPGAVDVLQFQNRPVPEISQPTQVRVQLKAAGVNPIDTKLRAGGCLLPEPAPHILGCDGAGLIDQIGPEVHGFRPGDAVYFCQGGLGGAQGNYAEQIVVDSRFIAHKPESLSFIEAAAAPLVLITAWESLYDRARLQADQTVLIHAGAGGVGHVAIQLAKMRRAKVCTTVSSAEKAEFVRKLGADRIIRYHQDNIVEEVRAWTDGEGVHVGFDTIGGDVFTQTIPAIRTYGDLVTILQIPDGVDWKEARIHNLRISQEIMLTPMLQHSMEGQAYHQGILTRCAELFDADLLQIRVMDTYPLTQVADAHRRLEEGHVSGKLVLTMDEKPDQKRSQNHS